MSNVGLGLRQRRKPLSKFVEECDAFPKVPEDYVEQTNSGASISIVTFFLVMLLIWSEVRYFLDPGYTFRFLPDTDFEGKISINLDMTVAMPCDSIGADILDSTNQNTFTFGRLSEENTWFELDHLQRKHFDSIQMFNSYLREEYHSLHELMWRSGQSALYGSVPKRRVEPDEPHDACRIHGSLTLNKVAGNFHITAGKSVPMMRGHAHLTAFLGPSDYNFSHRVEKFSFGSTHAGIVQPLEGDEKIAEKNMMSYQYFIQVVPTDVQTATGFTYSTCQYSVTDQERPIDHSSESHGTPGIFFKYDMSALKVKVEQDRVSLGQFMVRLCASVGGLVAISQFVCTIVKSCVEYYCCGKAGVASEKEVVKSGPALIPKELQQPEQTQAGVTLQEVEKLLKS